MLVVEPNRMRGSPSGVAMVQCKDIPNEPILQFLKKHKGQWATWFQTMEGGMPSVREAIPDDIPGKLVVAKMRQLIKNGLVKGCGCGCRGDYEITEKGERQLC